jgi:hypothetical protein
LVFHFFPFFFTHGSAWRHLQCDRYNMNVKFLIFLQEFLQGPQCWSLELRPLPTKIILAHSYLQIWSWDLRHVCSIRFGSEVQKTPKKGEDHLIFINFGVKKFTLKNTQKIKTLTFECHNLLDPMEWGVVIFGGWCSTR